MLRGLHMEKGFFVLLIPFHGILFPFCVNIASNDIFILWYLRCIIFLKHGLSYTIKQIYNKHKAICWARINAGEVMTRDDFIR